ncbi:efflux RND transporter periplasmic adaptor subunit [Massilia pseudoviolaceinigra]|uniref:efflux RND transporter periplasmic adaptor subunit n=1 Tax=Massilia pseudoviolaceinigra TaxID=3057165 RepID=UPI002796BDC1|nr:efflux RND transporter periplasmic adaptor subunit [Massilia sp. CCM 9206]MDQ1920373.1 efflux RND transporter periplasmic adaptor subunit [Massilia sp. CCM 9206]
MIVPIAPPAERSSGAAMDQPLQRRRGRRALSAAALALALLAGGAALWQQLPRGLQVARADARIASVTRGVFRDDVALRAIAAPLHSVMLDAVESGRVEEVFARDGAPVKQGEVLFRLSNPQRRLDLLAREAEHAQQISNLTNLRIALEASRRERERRGAELAFALALADKQHARNAALAQKGFVSSNALEDSQDRVAQQRRLYESEKAGYKSETATQRDAVRQMEQAIGRLEAGLQLVNATIDALAVRAPVSGRLTDFHLQVGETVKPDQHLGRIDDVDQFKLAARVDEYYLNRVAVGRQGTTTINGRAHALTVSRIYPQIKEGRFALELAFADGQPPTLNPGQGMEALVTLGGASEALLLPHDAFVNDSGGVAVYVLDKDGGTAGRRAIRTGRRNNTQVEVLAGLAPGERVIVSSYAGYGKAARLQFLD